MMGRKRKENKPAIHQEAEYTIYQVRRCGRLQTLSLIDTEPGSFNLMIYLMTFNVATALAVRLYVLGAADNTTLLYAGR